MLLCVYLRAKDDEESSMGDSSYADDGTDDELRDDDTDDYAGSAHTGHGLHHLQQQLHAQAHQQHQQHQQQHQQQQQQQQYHQQQQHGGAASSSSGSSATASHGGNIVMLDKDTDIDSVLKLLDQRKRPSAKRSALMSMFGELESTPVSVCYLVLEELTASGAVACGSDSVAHLACSVT
jgi:hypothetical protein